MNVQFFCIHDNLFIIIHCTIIITEGVIYLLNNYLSAPEFYPGDNVISIVYHLPEIQPGTAVKIVKPWFGNLCVVQLPNGMIHRWFAWFELELVNIHSFNESILPGSIARVKNSIGHGNPPHVEVGTTVRIVKCIPITFYDVILSNGEYHRWLAEFELAKPIQIR